MSNFTFFSSKLIPGFRCQGRTTLQNTTMRKFGGILLLLVAVNLVSPRPNPFLRDFPGVATWMQRYSARPTPGVAVMLSMLAAAPILLAIWTAANYLQREPDEYVRSLVVRAFLIGVAVMMVGDAIASTLSVFYATPFPVTILNADLLFAGTGLAFRALQWKNQ